MDQKKAKINVKTNRRTRIDHKRNIYIYMCAGEKVINA